MPDFSHCLPKSEITKLWWSPLFIKWVDKKLNAWRDASKRGNEGRELDKAIITRTGLFKPFYEEAYPFYRFLKNRKLLTWFSFCKLPCDSERHYDARIWSIFGSWKFEATLALEDRHDIRMEAMLSNGHAPMLASFKHEGTQNSRKIEFGDIVVSADEIIEKQVEWVRKAVLRKTENRTPNQDYSEVDKLIICIDDFDLLPEMHSRFRERVAKLPIMDQDTFPEIVVIGTMGKLDLSFNAGKTNQNG